MKDNKWKELLVGSQAPKRKAKQLIIFQEQPANEVFHYSFTLELNVAK